MVLFWDDSFTNIHQLLNGIHSPVPGGGPEVVISLNAEQAFDRVEWENVFMCLKSLGMALILVDGLNSYTSPKASVITNGKQSKYFQLSRATRQGCPVSPLFELLKASGKIIFFSGPIPMLVGGRGALAGSSACTSGFRLNAELKTWIILTIWIFSGSAWHSSRETAFTRIDWAHVCYQQTYSTVLCLAHMHVCLQSPTLRPCSGYSLLIGHQFLLYKAYTWHLFL